MHNRQRKKRGKSTSASPSLSYGRLKRLHRRSPAVIGSLLVAVWVVLSALGTAINLLPLHLLELQTQALFFQIRGAVPVPENVVIVAIDDESLSLWRNGREQKEFEPIQSWPWRRTAYAVAIENLMAAGARSVSLDLLLDIPSARPEDDQQLQKTLQRYAGRITLATSHTRAASSSGGELQALEQFLSPSPSLQTTPQSLGLINYPPELNSQVRRFTSLYLDYIEPGLRQSQTNLISFDEASLKAAQIPFEPPKGDYIFYYGGQSSFPIIPFWNLLDPKQFAQQRHLFRDKVVLIGATAEALQDILPTPFGDVSGIEIHANAISTLMENLAIAEVVPNPYLRGLLLLLGLAGIGRLLSRLSKRPVPRFLYSLGIAAAWAVAGYWSFTSAGLIVPTALPVIAIALSGLSYLSTGSIDDQLEKLRLRRTLERYVAAPIVQEILSQPEDFRALLQGRKVKAAVLFCDIRGFTNLSYKLPAEELIAQLNHYLNAMVEAIVETGGTVDKFIGDAVMAEFGAPVSRGETVDAMNAVRTALHMRRALADLRHQWLVEGKTLLFNGIGISYGEVIAGNIGSVQRLEYTVIGDTVNVASRVETLTKTLQTDILITESLYSLIQDQIEVIFVGEYPLRGREESPTRLYELVGLKGESKKLYERVQAELRRHLGDG